MALKALLTTVNSKRSMVDGNDVPSERLDTWKGIADYLGRDTRTVRRWETTLGLPVRRVGGRSVFAYKAEIDGWLLAHPLERPAAKPASGASPEAAPGPSRPGGRQWLWVGAGTALVLTSALVWATRPEPAADPVSVRVTPTAIVATDARGAERWQYAFPRDERVIPPTSHPDRPAVFPPGRNSEVIVATSYRERVADLKMSGGELLALTRDGRPSRRFAFDDRLAFGGAVFTGPWAITSFSVDDPGGRRRVAVGAHHHLWWPSVVAVLDERGARRGTFVNAGWVEGLRWLSPDRLLIAGFSNARDGGMVATLDANALNGQSPIADDATFQCTTCGPDVPLRYVVLPRSEVNVATVSPFNRAMLTATDDHVIVRTLEVPSAGPDAVDAVYEFSPQLDLVRASYSDRYWQTHRALEAHGKLNHSRAQCPESRGPLAIHVWDRETGWTRAPVRRD